MRQAGDTQAHPPTSKKVGTTLKTMLERVQLMPRVPRSITRLRAPAMQKGKALSVKGDNPAWLQATQACRCLRSPAAYQPASHIAFLCQAVRSASCTRALLLWPAHESHLSGG